jgi:uncharacterized membrane protein
VRFRLVKALFWVAFWFAAFAATHLALSSARLRPALLARLGEKGFLGLYSAVALATFVPFVWVYFSNRRSGPLLWGAAAVPGARPLALVLSALGLALVAGALAQPSPALDAARPDCGSRGLTRVTRHPLFMGIALWALGHLLVNGFATDAVFFGGLLVFSLAGAAHQDARLRASGEARLERFYAETSFWPFAAILSGRNRLAWAELPWGAAALGVVLALGLYALHPWAFGG